MSTQEFDELKQLLLSFEERLGKRIDKVELDLRQEMNVRFADLETKMQQGFARLETKVDDGFAGVGDSLEQILSLHDENEATLKSHGRRLLRLEHKSPKEV